MFKQTLTALLFAATLYAPHALAADAPPFVPTTITTGNDFAANTVWYTFQNGQKGFYLSNPEGEDFIALNRSRIREVSDKYLWCFVGNNTDGYRIYNKAAGAGKVLAAPSVVTGNGGESFAVLKDAKQLDGYTDLWILSTSNDLTGKRAFYLNVKDHNSWKLNNRNDKLAFWTDGADHGSSFVVNTLKEAGEGGEVTVSPSTGALTSSNPSSSYKKLWSSNSAVPLTLDAGANNMNVVNDILQLHAGSSKRCNYVFSVPVGYAVKSIEFDFQLGKATDKEVNIEGYGQRFKVSGDVQHFSAKIAGTENAATFLLSGENVPVKFMNAKVVVERVNVTPESQVNVFDYKADTREGYRIPAIAVTGKSGAVVAFSDARYTPGASDIGNGRVDLVVSRSEDNGKTWSAPEVMKDKDGKPVAQGDGRMVGGDPNKSRTAGYGDPAVVADRESDDVLVMSVSGFTNFFAARRETPNAVARWFSNDGGKTFTQHEDITDHIYKQFDNTTPRGKIESMFFGSGRITQSRRIKVGTHYRIYAVLSGLNVNPQNIANWVMYSDDFGKNWKILGDAMTPAIPHSADEPKCEELPDGSIVVSSRRGYGRWFNVFRFTDSAKGEGYWEEMAHSPLVKASDNACNGELLIVPVVKKATNEKMYLALQSIPFGPGRTNVGINYKELADASDFSSSANFAKQWDGAHKASQYGSAYSVMAWQKNNTLAFMYEEDPEVAHPGYTQVYKNYTIEQITDGAYSYAADDDMTVAKALTKKVVDARVAEAKQHVGTGIGQYPAEVAGLFDQVAAAYQQKPSDQVYEALNIALKSAPVNEVTDKQFYYLQNDGYKTKENKSYYLQFDENQKPKGVDAYDDTDEKQYFIFYKVPNKPGHYYIHNDSWSAYLLPLQNDNQEVLTTDKQEKAGVYVLEHLGNGESLIRCVNAKNPAHPYLHLAGDQKLVCWEGKNSAPSHWRIRPVGLATAIKSAAAKSASAPQLFDLSGRKVSQDHKGLKISKTGKTF